MYCKVHRPTATPGSPDNKGRCTLLVEYLSKEGRTERPYYDNFFHNRMILSPRLQSGITWTTTTGPWEGTPTSSIC